MNSQHVILGLFALLIGLTEAAVAQTHKGLSFQGVIKLPNNEYPTASGVTVQAKILSPNNCILRAEEFQSVNISNGYINLVIGSGTVTSEDPGLNLKQAMDNSAIIANGPSKPGGLVCLDSNGNVTGTTAFDPAGTSGARKFRVELAVSSMPVKADFNMRAVAYAVNAESLNGKTENDLLNINSAKSLTQAHAESIFERFTKLDALLNNSNPAATSLGVNITGTAATATTVAGGINSLLPAQATNAGKYLKTDGTNVTWETAAGSSGLTQVGIDLPTSVFTNGADITVNGKVSATFISQNAKTFFAGPTSGTGVPSFRALTTADVGSFDTDVDTRADARITAAKNVANGIAGLDANTKIPLTLLPNDAVFGTSVKTGTVKLTGPSSSEIQLAAPTAGVTSYNIALPPAAGTAGQVLKIGSVSGTDLSLAWDTVTSSGGTVTSVGLSLPSSVFDVTGSPVAASGVITGSLKNQNANLIFAGPSSGGAAAPGFRSLTASDLPNLGWNQITGVLSSEQIASHTPSFIANGLVLTGATNVAEPVVLSPCIGVVKSSAAAFSCAPLAGTDLATDIIATAHIANGAVTDAKIAGVAAGKISGTVSAGNLPVASGTADGIVNQATQSFAGIKTFVSNVVMQGSLAVTGAVSADRIKLANSSATCDAAIEGSLRYNTTTKGMEFCNGATWQNIVQGDPCLSGSPAIGTTCPGGTIYLGQFDGGKYMVTPSGCTNSTTPTCAGGTDTTTKFWNDGTTTWVDIPGVETFTTASQKSSSSYRGNVNTDAIIVQHGTAANAAKYCQDMVYGGYSDWYLPSKSELAYMYCKATPTGTHNTSYPQEEANCVAYGGKQSILTGFAANYYWSSTEYTNALAWIQHFNDGNQSNPGNKTSAYPVRCLRRY